MNKEQVLKAIDEVGVGVDQAIKATWTLGFISGLWIASAITEETYNFIHNHRVREEVKN